MSDSSAVLGLPAIGIDLAGCTVEIDIDEVGFVGPVDSFVPEVIVADCFEEVDSMFLAVLVAAG